MGSGLEKLWRVIHGALDSLSLGRKPRCVKGEIIRTRHNRRKKHLGRKRKDVRIMKTYRITQRQRLGSKKG